MSTPLKIHRGAINAMEILSAQTKDNLWKLATEAKLMVQRINRNVFAVRSKPSLTFPTGFLHVNFNNASANSK